MKKIYALILLLLGLVLVGLSLLQALAFLQSVDGAFNGHADTILRLGVHGLLFGLFTIMAWRAFKSVNTLLASSKVLPTMDEYRDK